MNLERVIEITLQILFVYMKKIERRTYIQVVPKCFVNMKGHMIIQVMLKKKLYVNLRPIRLCYFFALKFLVIQR